MPTKHISYQRHYLKQEFFVLDIRLQRPKAINALNTEMVNEISRILTEFSNDEKLVAVVLSGVGEKGFCAGGDIRLFYDSAICQKNPYVLAEQFFDAEYFLDQQLANYPKPIICFASANVLGGGLGLLWASDFRILTKTSCLAMPEISIGLYPDAGGSYYLNQIDSAFAKFLALTAYRMTANDFLLLGYSGFLTDKLSLDVILENLAMHYWSTCKQVNKQQLETILEKYSVDANVHESLLYKHHDFIQLVFSADSIFEIDAKLRKTLIPDDLQIYVDQYFSGSILSAYLIVEQLKKAKNISLAEAFDLEKKLSSFCLREGDLTEGIRALVIDKDKRPTWKFQNLQQLQLALPIFFR